MRCIPSKAGAYGLYPGTIELQSVVKELNHAGFQNSEICLLLAPGHPIAAEMREMRSSGKVSAPGCPLELLVQWLSALGAVVISNMVFFVRSAVFLNALADERTSPVPGHRAALANLGIAESQAAHLGSRISNGGGLIYVDCSRTSFLEPAMEIFRRTGAEETSCLKLPPFSNRNFPCRNRGLVFPEKRAHNGVLATHRYLDESLLRFFSSPVSSPSYHQNYIMLTRLWLQRAKEILFLILGSLQLLKLFPALLLGLGALIVLAGCSRQRSAPPDGSALFLKKCASCHRTGNDMRAPEPDMLHQMTKASIMAALETGRMKWEGKFISMADKNAIAQYLGVPDVPATAALKGLCARDLDPPAHLPQWSGWGGNLGNARYQAGHAAGLNREQVKNLKLKWSFGFPGAAATFGQPTVFAGKLFVGSEDGTVNVLDAATGCLWWTFKASATVKTAISIGNQGATAFFGDTNGYVYALRTADGAVIWKVHADSHPQSRITGSPLLVERRLYVPISSGEEGAAADARYPCCTFRGSVVALDAGSGKRIWQSYTIDQLPQPTRKSSQGVQYWGPSGAAVWSTPTADVKRRVIYVTTGNNYSAPSTASSDAVIALDMKTGKKRWSRQFTQKDLWNSGCVAEQKDNCPDPRGADFDFGAPPVLKSLGGRDILLLTQKSGMVYALDPERSGKLLWQARVGRGGPLGGIEWGGAADGRNIYVPLSDYDDANPLAGGGLFALDLLTGKQAWHVAPVKPPCAGQTGCSAAQMAPPTAIPGVVLVGSLDGHLRAYDTRNGYPLWDFDTARPFQTTNGVDARGGSLTERVRRLSMAWCT